jgi:hypothetical protein
MSKTSELAYCKYSGTDCFVFCSCFISYAADRGPKLEPQLCTVRGFKLCNPTTVQDATHIIYKPWGLNIYILDKLRSDKIQTLMTSILGESASPDEVTARLIYFAHCVLQHYRDCVIDPGLFYQHGCMFVTSGFIIAKL